MTHGFRIYSLLPLPFLLIACTDKFQPTLVDDVEILISQRPTPPIRSIRVREFSFPRSLTDSGTVEIFALSFDSVGRVISRVTPLTSGLTYIMLSRYDTLGRRTGEEYYQESSEGIRSAITTMTFEFDAYGRIVRRIYDPGGRIESTETLFYDGDRLLAESWGSPLEGSVGTRLNDFDDNGRLKGSVWYYGPGQPQKRELREYDTHGRLSAVTLYDSAGFGYEETRYDYDRSNRLVELRTRHPDPGMVTTFEYTYDARKLLSSRTELRSDIPVRGRVYEYEFY